MRLRHNCLRNVLLINNQRTIRITNIFFILLNLIVFVNGGILVDYTEKQIWDYVRNIPRENITQNCATSLDKVIDFLKFINWIFRLKLI